VRLHVPIELRWSDIDAYAHVNNVAMLGLLEEARIEGFWIMGEGAVGDGQNRSPVLDFRPGAGTLSLIVHQQVEYLLAIPYQRRPLDVEMWIGRLGGSSLQFCYEVYSPVGQEPRLLYTRAETTLVLADATDSRPRRLAPSEREAWTPYLEAPVVFRSR
jgi:acyl-CoA thioester hydrolase